MRIPPLPPGPYLHRGLPHCHLLSTDKPQGLAQVLLSFPVMVSSSPLWFFSSPRTGWGIGCWFLMSPPPHLPGCLWNSQHHCILWDLIWSPYRGIGSNTRNVQKLKLELTFVFSEMRMKLSLGFWALFSNNFLQEASLLCSLFQSRGCIPSCLHPSPGSLSFTQLWKFWAVHCKPSGSQRTPDRLLFSSPSLVLKKSA